MEKLTASEKEYILDLLQRDAKNWRSEEEMAKRPSCSRDADDWKPADYARVASMTEEIARKIEALWFEEVVEVKTIETRRRAVK